MVETLQDPSFSTWLSSQNPLQPLMPEFGRSSSTGSFASRAKKDARLSGGSAFSWKCNSWRKDPRLPLSMVRDCCYSSTNSSALVLESGLSCFRLSVFPDLWTLSYGSVWLNTHCCFRTMSCNRVLLNLKGLWFVLVHLHLLSCCWLQQSIWSCAQVKHARGLQILVFFWPFEHPLPLEIHLNCWSVYWMYIVLFLCCIQSHSQCIWIFSYDL